MCRLYSIEGPEGSGKTTLSKLVASKLEELGVQAIVSREPGGVTVAEKIRDIVVHNNMNNMTEALLFLAARTEHYYSKIKPLIDKGSIVILDRFIYSSLSIQGAARGMGAELIANLHKLALPRDLEFITFYLDVDPIKGLERKQEQGELQKFEFEDEEFHLKAHRFMLNACQHDGVVRVPALKTLEEIAEEIVQYILCFSNLEEC